MNNNNSLIIENIRNDLWLLNLSQHGILTYKLISGEGKYKEEGTIDSGVIEFASDIDDNGTKHLVYINKSGNLKCCKFIDGQWSTKTIYQIKNNSATIRELSLYVTDNNLDIFYIHYNPNSQAPGILCHNRWDGEKCQVFEISYIKLLPDVHTHYQIDIREKKEILLFFIYNTGKEVVFRNCRWQNNAYSAITTLFSLKGNSLDFFLAKYGAGFHMLNVSYVNSTYTLEDRTFDSFGKVLTITNIFQCNLRIFHPLLIVDKNSLWAFWRAGGKIFYSSLSNRWSKVEELKTEYKGSIYMYYYIRQTQSGNSTMKRVFGTASPNINFLLPPSSQETMGKVKKENPAYVSSTPMSKAGSRPSPLSNSNKTMVQMEKKSTYLSPGINRNIREVNKDGYNVSDIRLIHKEGAWDKELIRNQIILSQEKASLETQCAELKKALIDAQGQIKIFESGSGHNNKSQNNLKGLKGLFQRLIKI